MSSGDDADEGGGDKLDEIDEPIRRAARRGVRMLGLLGGRFGHSASR